MRVRNEFPDFSKDKRELDRLFRTLPTTAGNIAVRFFVDRFKRQGWQGNGFQAWEPRKRLDRQDQRRGVNSRALLVGSGRLRRSIRILKTSPNSVTVGSTLKYASIHNEGGTIQHPGGTAFIKKKGKLIYISNKKARGKKYPRTKPHNITIPQRKFIGRSPVLDKRIVFHIERQLRNILS